MRGCAVLGCRICERKLTRRPNLLSDEAADYDAKHEKTIAEIARRIEARKHLIGVEWVEDEDDSPDEKGRAVRVLDYACGTGSMSRVSILKSFIPCDGLNMEYTEEYSRGRLVPFSLSPAPSVKTQTNQYRYDRLSRRTPRSVWALTSPRRWWTCITRVLVTRYVFATPAGLRRPSLAMKRNHVESMC